MTRDAKWLLEEKYGGQATSAYHKDLARLAEGEPLAYVIGTTPFLGLTINLNSKPLIPRVETEWWTHELLNSLPATAPLTFLDMCSGSGAIGCAALARLPNARVYFGEFEPAHEAGIRATIYENGLDASRAVIGIGDLFDPFPRLKFDVIAANPPYIPSGRKLPDSVSRYEPPTALYSGMDGLQVTCRIIEQLPDRLNPGGKAWIECDEHNAPKAAALFKKSGMKAELRTDQYGKPRVIVASV